MTKAATPQPVTDPLHQAGGANATEADGAGLLQAQLDQQAETSQARARHLAHLEEMVRVRDEGIAWLRGELSRLEAENRLMAASKFWRLGLAYWRWRERLLNWTWPVRHPQQWLGLHAGYWKLRSRVKRGLLRAAPARFRRMVEARGRPVTVSTTPAAVVEPPGPVTTGYEGLCLLPALPLADLRSTLKALPAMATAGTDVICFSIIDWSFRYQRPQQLMAQFAAHGHRVFYLSTTKFLPAGGQPAFTVSRVKENIYEVCLAAAQAPDVYRRVTDGQTLETLLDSLAALREAYQIQAAVGYVMTVSWSQVALEARTRWAWPVVYDCMDEWENFPGIGRSLVEMEPRLVEACDVLVVSGQRLYEKWRATRRSIILARNAVDYAFYAQRCQPNARLADLAHPIVGYYGAIADWFDLDLMAQVARQRPGYNFVLLGGVFGVDVSALKALANVRLLGQQAYETMPEYLYHFDACLIPFKINSITRATDPVKVYEYLSGGKPVVAVALPELEALRGFIYLAQDADEFLQHLDTAVAEADPALADRRKALAAQHTWEDRYQQIVAGLAASVPRVSIVIVTYNNLELTQLCLASLLRSTTYLNYEVIVVDNHSSDGTPLYLRHLAEHHPQIRLISNSENRGFARANNQALAEASGEYLVLLNNDTVVPFGWLNRLLDHLADESVGLVGPVTNFAGNEARVDVSYGTWGEMEALAWQRAKAHARQAADIHVLAMYCVALRRSVWAKVGLLDEQFEIGMFEDDDYAERIRAQGYRVVCALDVYVHHVGQAAFKKLIANGEYDRLFEANRRRYEMKWTTTWVPHRPGVLRPIEHSASARSVPASARSVPALTHGPNDIAAQEDYARQLRLENQKWGQHLSVEASGEWHAWLDHPMILAHYQERGRIDGRAWEAWLVQHWAGPAERSLDLGCGSAGKSLSLWEAGATRQVDGLDISEGRVAAGQQRRLQMGVPGKFWIEDANTVTLPAGAYDLIFSSHSFHHFLRLEHILAQVARALTARGIFVLEEFVGPTQFQWTDRQLQQTNGLLQSLPSGLRTFRNDQVKIEEGRPTPEQVVAVSPFEAIRSADIWPLFQQYFDVVAVRHLGGTIQHLLYNGIVHNFSPGDEAAAQHIRAIYGVEDRLIDTGQLPSDFRLLIGRKKPTVAGRFTGGENDRSL